jgi:thiol-disulfide isomerase/thioredoxin
LSTIAQADVPAPPRRRVPAWAIALPVVLLVITIATGIGMVMADRSSSPVWVAAGTARVGGIAPNFTSSDLGGNRVSLSEFKGRAVLLTFWATWCTVCKDELPALQVLQERYRSDGFAVLAVNYRESGNERMRRYLAGINVTLQSVVDPGASIASVFGVDIGLPVNVLVDGAGRVVRIMVGEVPIASIEAAVKQVVTPTAH